jgi:hypothetical protein
VSALFTLFFVPTLYNLIETLRKPPVLDEFPTRTAEAETVVEDQPYVSIPKER